MEEFTMLREERVGARGFVFLSLCAAVVGSQRMEEFTTLREKMVQVVLQVVDTGGVEVLGESSGRR